MPLRNSRKNCKYGMKKDGYCKKSPVSMKIKKLIKEGYPRKQAIAIALSMKSRNRLGPRGGYKRSSRKKSRKRSSRKRSPRRSRRSRKRSPRRSRRRSRKQSPRRSRKSRRKSRIRSRRRSRRRYNYKMRDQAKFLNKQKINFRNVDQYLLESRENKPNIIEFLNTGDIYVYDNIGCFSRVQGLLTKKLYTKLRDIIKDHNIDNYYVICPLHGKGRRDCGGNIHIQLLVTGTYNTIDGNMDGLNKPVVNLSSGATVGSSNKESIFKNTNHREIFEETGLNVRQPSDKIVDNLIIPAKDIKTTPFPFQEWRFDIITEFNTKNQEYPLQKGEDNKQFKIMSIIYNTYDKVINDLRGLQFNHYINRGTKDDNWRFLDDDNLIGVAAVKLSHIFQKLKL